MISQKKQDMSVNILLCFRRLVNLFNRTLVTLAIIDNIYIICDLLESFYQFGPESTSSTILR